MLSVTPARGLSDHGKVDFPLSRYEAGPASLSGEGAAVKEMFLNAIGHALLEFGVCAQARPKIMRV
jgi:hypothetical protein